MTKTYKTKGFVLGIKTMAESDQWVQVFSRDKGRFTAIGKSSKKSSSRRIPDVASECAFVLYKGRSIPMIQQVEISQPFLHIRDRFDAISMAFHFVDIARQVLPVEQPNVALYDVLYEGLMQLNQGIEVEVAKQVFYTEFLHVEGIGIPKGPVSDRDFQLAFEAYSGRVLTAPLRINSSWVMM